MSQCVGRRLPSDTGRFEKTEEARLFRQKLMQRPLALRCGTCYIQPHELHSVVLQYLDGPVDSPSHTAFISGRSCCAPGVSAHYCSCAVVERARSLQGSHTPWLETSVCVTAVLWIACSAEGFTNPLATTHLDCKEVDIKSTPIRFLCLVGCSCAATAEARSVTWTQWQERQRALEPHPTVQLACQRTLLIPLRSC